MSLQVRVLPWGAGASDPLARVPVLLKGVGDIDQPPARASRASPEFGCAADWNVCYPDRDVAEAPTPDPDDACDEQSTLELGGGGGLFPPDGGYVPLANGGWMKSTGDIQLRLGLHVRCRSPTEDFSLEDYGRLERVLEGDQLANPDKACCLIANEYNSASREDGERRFARRERRVQELVSEEMMALTTSRALACTQACGDESDTYYWRHAAGSADASNLSSGGRFACPMAASSGWWVTRPYRSAAFESSSWELLARTTHATETLRTTAAWP